MSIQRTSKISNLGFLKSKWPYLLHKMGFGDSQSSSTVYVAVQKLVLGWLRDTNLFKTCWLFKIVVILKFGCNWSFLRCPSNINKLVFSVLADVYPLHITVVASSANRIANSGFILTYSQTPCSLWRQFYQTIFQYNIVNKLIAALAAWIKSRVEEVLLINDWPTSNFYQKT